MACVRLMSACTRTLISTIGTIFRYCDTSWLYAFAQFPMELISESMTHCIRIVRPRFQATPSHSRHQTYTVPPTYLLALQKSITKPHTGVSCTRMRVRNDRTDKNNKQKNNGLKQKKKRLSQKVTALSAVHYYTSRYIALCHVIMHEIPSPQSYQCI